MSAKDREPFKLPLTIEPHAGHAVFIRDATGRVIAAQVLPDDAEQIVSIFNALNAMGHYLVGGPTCICGHDDDEERTGLRFDILCPKHDEISTL